MKRAIFITVRTGSTRLPKKCLLEIAGLTTIQHLIRRVKKSKMANVVVLCTTHLAEDDVLEEIAKKENIECFRGSVKDKLERWRGAAEKFHVDFFVTADGDDLFCEPELIDLAFVQAESKGPDFIKGDGVRGVDVPVGAFTYGIKVKALQRVCIIKDTDDTEMMWAYFEDTGFFNCQKLENVPGELKRPEIRMTLDYPDDFKFFQTVIGALGTDVGLRDVLEYLDKHPEVIAINQHLQKGFRANQKSKTRLLLKRPRVLFYTSIPRSFQTTLIGNLYELCQLYPVVLIAEELNDATKELLGNKALFPKLEKVIFVEQYTGEKRNLLSKYYYLFKTAKKIVKEYKPDIVITVNDVYPFEMYLMRFAKKTHAVNVCFQAALQMKDRKGEVAWWVLQNAHLRYPRFLPLPVRLLLAKLKKLLAYGLYYWILPVCVGQKPFLGKSSFLDWHAALTPQVCDFQVVFSERDYAIYKAHGFPTERLLILPHPLKRKTREIFESLQSSALRVNPQKRENTITVMWPDETISFRRRDYSIIPKEELQQKRIEIITRISQILGDWKIFIKPHPAVKDDTNKFQEIKNSLEPISSNIQITNPEEMAETYIQISNVVVGFPPASTAIFVASLWYPEKPILSLDFQHELLGNFYEDVEGVEFIDSEEKFIEVLQLIRAHQYQKELKTQKRTIQKEFLSTTGLLKSLYMKKF